jgi:hypothetical protein
MTRHSTSPGAETVATASSGDRTEDSQTGPFSSKSIAPISP